MRRILSVCEVLCIVGMFGGCDVSQASPAESIDAAAQPSVSTPTTEATGVTPASGWAASYDPSLLVYQRRNDGTVLFHGGTWTVPFTARPGESIAGAVFTIEAPTGHAGDPATVAVELFSNQAAAALGQTQLTPFGLGARVNGNIPLSTPRVVAPGETFQLVFVPLLGGDYATNDTTIDSIGILRPRALAAGGTTWIPASSFVITNGTATLDDGIWSPNGPISLTRWESPTPLSVGDVLDSAEAFYVRHGIVDSTDAYTMKIRQRTTIQGSAVPASVDIGSAQVNGAAASAYPSIDRLLAASTAIAANDAAIWIRFEIFENNQSSGISHAKFLGVRLTAHSVN